ncbi:MAG: hypothetical protein IT163_14135 [Bryobacterales bacterium]|nr:hypothetical protein [Bryobacterales bacterium]
MRRAFLFSLALLLFSTTAPAAPVRASFGSGPAGEQRWSLKDLDPTLPSDWTPFNFLVLELRVSSPQRFFLTVHSGSLDQRRAIQPFAGVWIRAAIPLLYFRQPNRAGFDLASVGKIPRDSFWMSTGGVYGPLNAVTALSVSMQTPLGNPTLDIRSIRLAKEDPGSDVLDHKPVVDQFGQWIPADWPGKIISLQQLQSEWKAEEASLRPGGFGYCPYGGYSNTRARATGYFRVDEIEGRWWFIDPDGHHFFSTSATGMGAGGSDSRLAVRASYYAAMPPIETNPSPTVRPRTGFYTWNLQRRHGPGWATKWIDLILRRLDYWGMNTVGNWSDSNLWDSHKKPYVVNLRGWGMETGFLGMPDVFSEEFPKTVDRAAAEQCARRKSDPYLLGYFIANEPPWPGRESLVVDIILDRPPTATQREAKAFLASGDTPERRRQFVYRCFDRYLEVINAALRRHDPNHLNLGLRFGSGLPPAEMLRASKSFDVYSMNVYSTVVSRETLDQIYQATHRPIIIGEFHFGVPGRGLAPGLVQVRDQAERGNAYRYYVEQAAAHPAFIGTSWFQWVDQPSTGRMDGENYNIGLVDVTDRPYPELVKAMRTTHGRLQAVHSGKTLPFDQKPRPQ